MAAAPRWGDQRTAGRAALRNAAGAPAADRHVRRPSGVDCPRRTARSGRPARCHCRVSWLCHEPGGPVRRVYRSIHGRWRSRPTSVIRRRTKPTPSRRSAPARASWVVSAGLDTIAGPPGTLRTRVGIASGVVVIGDLTRSGSSFKATAVGDTPSRAARLQAAAEPGAVVISELHTASHRRSFRVPRARFLRCEGITPNAHGPS